MINGAHFLLYTSNPDQDRAFLRDVLDLRSVDVGGGWLIFALPPAELAVHPSAENFVQRDGGDGDLLGAVLYLMCDDLPLTIAALEAKHVSCAPVGRAEWGAFTSIRLPSGGQLGLYQPMHPTAIERR